MNWNLAVFIFGVLALFYGLAVAGLIALAIVYHKDILAEKLTGILHALAEGVANMFDKTKDD